MAHLLDSGADVDARDNTGVTALHWACASGSLDAVKLLVKHNAFLNYVETEGDKLAPLDYAISGEHQDVAQVCKITFVASLCLQVHVLFYEKQTILLQPVYFLVFGQI